MTEQFALGVSLGFILGAAAVIVKLLCDAQLPPQTRGAYAAPEPACRDTGIPPAPPRSVSGSFRDCYRGGYAAPPGPSRPEPNPTTSVPCSAVSPPPPKRIIIEHRFETGKE